MTRKAPKVELLSIAHLATFSRTVCDQVLRIELNKYRDNPGSTIAETIEFRHPTDVVAMARPLLEKMGFKPVRITRNLLNPNSRDIVIDADTPLCCDPGSETYHSM